MRFIQKQISQEFTSQGGDSLFLSHSRVTPMGFSHSWIINANVRQCVRRRKQKEKFNRVVVIIINSSTAIETSESSTNIIQTEIWSKLVESETQYYCFSLHKWLFFYIFLLAATATLNFDCAALIFFRTCFITFFSTQKKTA